MTPTTSQHIPEVAGLLVKIEERYGRPITTSADFESLSVVIEHEIGEYVSSATLKRLWGYVTLRPVPRVSTLNVLSRFVGYPSFKAFCEQLKKDPAEPSGFFTTSCVTAADLAPGGLVQVGWSPDRLVTLEYQGNSAWKVLESYNAKLQAGDVFYVAQLMLGYPLYIDHIQRGDKATASYVAGKNGGLTILKKIRPEQA